MLLRSSTIRHICVVLIACWSISSSARAQDFKIYTPVYDMNAPQTSPRAGQRPQPEIIARTQSYFHAGKAYDVIEARQSEQQILIYEPNAQRFTIVNPTREMATLIAFDELEKMVRAAETSAQNHVLREREKGLEPATRIDMIEFQLQPSFKETFDRRKNTLTLTSPQMTYQVKCESLGTPERTQFYLKYCDWMARLNFVLHPQAPLPGPRLTLNGSLRNHDMMPTEVTLLASIGGGVNLRAQHKIESALEPGDRQRIHQWQTMLESEEMKFVPFKSFREVQLADKR